MSDTLKQIDSIIHALAKNTEIKWIGMTPFFHDEPKPYKYSMFIEGINNPKNKAKKNEKIFTAGISFISPEVALLKCIAEGGERVCLFKNKNIKQVIKKYSQFEDSALDPRGLIKEKNISNVSLAWVEGFNLSKNIKSYIPSQLVYLDAPDFQETTILTHPKVSTGAAAGLGIEFALLGGICEVIERDAFMGVYLNTITPSSVDLSKVKNEEIVLALKAARRYNLDLQTFDISSDLGIPTYMSVLIDRTGMGYPVSLGLKTSLNREQAILGSLLEPYVTMHWTRELLGDKSLVKTLNLSSNMIKRIALWSNPEMLNKLAFLFNGKKKTIKKGIKLNEKQELKKIIRLLSEKGFDIYYVDITLPSLKKAGLHVLKVIIPGLQPLYLNEAEKVNINKKRIFEIARYYGKKELELNPIPHPFL